MLRSILGGQGKTIVFLSICLVLAASSQAQGQALDTASFPSLASSLKVPSDLSFCNEPVPLKEQRIKERLEKELLLSLWDRPQVILWLKRSGRYFPFIEKRLAKNGMPEDLKYVAVVESALRPHVGSSKGAVGFWQFTPDTGRRYGLRIDDTMDERRNVSPSTEAALKYFKDLHDMFGSWTMAAAAYNMGEQGLMAECLVQGIQDYYRLYLPLETQRFLFRILSVKLIFSGPERYGFHLSEEDYYPPPSIDRVEVECFQAVPLRVIGRAARTDFKTIKDLNPELRGYSLAPGTYTLAIPQGASAGFHSRLKKHLESALEIRKKRVYVVQEGDNLSSIAERFHLPLPALLILNRLNPNDPIHPGDRLIISPNTLEKE